MTRTNHGHPPMRFSEKVAFTPDRAAPFRVALAFPNTYSFAAASLGYQLVYALINSLPLSSCERVVLPSSPGERPLTIETGSPLSEFDVVAFSIYYEMDYLNVLSLLETSSIPIRSAERGDTQPLVLAGGPCATFNPEPLADFVDAFVIGDAEDVLPKLIAAIASSAGEARSVRLRSASEIESVYVPALFEHYQGARAKRAIANVSDTALVGCITSPLSEFGNARLVEVSRGCARRCRFCVTGHINRPFRPRPLPDHIQDERLALVGSSVFDNKNAEEFCRSIVTAGETFGLSSLRAETLTDSVAELMVLGGIRTATIAPEAGSERLRRVLNKNTHEERLFEAADSLSRAGIGKVKLYFMAGLPTETDEDADQIVDMVRRMATRFARVDFGVSVSCFVPKPWTPFQWLPMADETTLKRRLAIVRQGLKGIARVKFSAESPRLAAIQGLLARGDHTLGLFLEDALHKGGNYTAALRETGVSLNEYLYRTRNRDETLPWDFIDMDLDKSKLWDDYEGE